jgi:hypothetical protein
MAGQGRSEEGWGAAAATGRGKLARPSWKAMSRSPAMMRGGVHERWQGTLLRSGFGSTARGRSAASVCRRVLVVLLWRMVARRAASVDVAAAAVARQRCPAMAPEQETEREREGRKRKREKTERRESTEI